MNHEDPRLELIRRHLDGNATPEELTQLEEQLRQDPEFRVVYVRYMNTDVGLYESVQPRASAVESHKIVAIPEPNTQPKWFRWRPLTAAAAGLVIGLFTASVAWAISNPRVTSTILHLSALADASFEGHSGMVPSGLPVHPGVWSGDASEIVEAPTQAREGRRALRFLKAEGAPQDATQQSNSCDVYQLVDLRSLRNTLEANEESDLQLTVSFLDARTEAGNPVRFTAFLFLMQGDPAALQQAWPVAKETMVGGGQKAFVSNGGGDRPQWKTLTVRCAFSAQADFALIQIGAGRDVKANTPHPELGAQFVDDVQLTLKTRPALPVRVLSGNP
ncbi:MAG: hypothetical protein WCO60_04540 [Verrucomicrobiota bacterium]